jgi:membrane-bound ClpP family serine protease
MSITVVLLLLILAIGLVLIEIFLIPGVGIPGIAGAVLMLVSLYLAYDINTTYGHYTLGATALTSAGLIALAFRAKTWDKMSLKTGIEARIQSHHKGLTIGQKGVALSRLNPIGKGRFGDSTMEVASKGDFIDAESPIEIVNIEGNKIIVQSI